MKILLIAGGWSSEREVSLKSAENMARALTGLGHAVTSLDLQADFDQLVPLALQNDFAFIGLHGAPGEDGLVQAMLDAINIPYQGSGPAGSFLALNKAAAKQLFRHAGLPTADWEFLPARPDPDWKPGLKFPMFVKSNTGGSSLRLGRVTGQEELNAMLNEIFAANEEALLEPEIKGREITCGVLGGQALPPILIEPVVGDFFDFTSKYLQGGAREICPAPLDAKDTALVQELALKAHAVLGLAGCSRSDFILDAEGKFTLLEVNTLPGMTATSLLPQEAAAIGIDFPQLLQTLIDLGIKRNSQRSPGFHEAP
ncbi:MAG: D-alanine--D-alanine ligase [Desulfovibrio sp.]|nr:D-alanine--D-alanine ligase [Desulfovibrio sp.]